MTGAHSEYTHVLECPPMERKKRTVISIDEYQPQFDFEEAEHSPPFTFPEYQKDLVADRLSAGAADFAVVGLVYVLLDRKSTRLNSSHVSESRMPSSA